MSQLFNLPPLFEEALEKRLQKLSFSLKTPEKLAQVIRQLSNRFIKGGEFENYWTDDANLAAYISYFTVLNFLRARSVFREAHARAFLKGAKVIADWGCGIGAATWALCSEWQGDALPELIGVDAYDKALDEFKHWAKEFEIKATTQKAKLSDLKNVKADTLVLSYVLNEADVWPEIPSFVKRLVIIEPSTHQAGRRLLQWRNERLLDSWYAWAPCTHQHPCPLLVHSGKDWCHHRIQWTKPGWFSELERFLPMRNDTLTLSYLLLSRDKPARDLTGIARVVGDEQEEKGKSRQMICRGAQREFLSWLHRDQISLKLKRGDLIEIGDVEQRVSELRVIIPENIKKI